MSFTPEQLRQLRLADQVEEDAVHAAETERERRARHSRESVERRIARIGLDEFYRIKREQAKRWAERRKAGLTRTYTPRNTR